MPSYSCGPRRHAAGVRAACATGRSIRGRSITHRFALDDVQTAFDTARAGGAAIKVIVTFPEEPDGTEQLRAAPDRRGRPRPPPASGVARPSLPPVDGAPRRIGWQGVRCRRSTRRRPTTIAACCARCWSARPARGRAFTCATSRSRRAASRRWSTTGTSTSSSCCAAAARCVWARQAHEVGFGDTVYVAPHEVHQLRNASATEPFGFLCMVDAERDRPTVVGASSDCQTGECGVS